MDEKVVEEIRALPEQPGCYIFRGAGGEILYVGKARSLRDRVRSYIQPAGHTAKIAQMVSEAASVEVIVTDSEVEALILENNLVKKEKPRYNTDLRDDKNFPYLKVSSKDPFPRVSLVRRAGADGSLYVGPYLPASNARRTLKMVQTYFGVATCHERLDGSRPRPCLYYQLDQCLGPCAGLADAAEYGRAVRDVEMFLQGKSPALLASLEEKMAESAAAEAYERAAHYRDLIRTVHDSMERQHLASVGLEDQDFFHFHREGSEAMVQLFVMREGLVQARREFSFDGVEEDDASFMALILERYYGGGGDVPAEVYAATQPAGGDVIEAWLTGIRGTRVAIRTSQRGVKSRLMDLVQRNARLAFEARFRAPHGHGVQVLDLLQELLGLAEIPYRIDAFDISHIQGRETVASMVVWEGGRPRKSEYRRFRIRTVKGVDDFASMAEVVARRYARVLKEGKNLPDFALIDGGKGQLEAARTALAGIGVTSLPLAAIAKREELLFQPERADPIRLDHASPILHLIQRIRDEAHRFAITYHRSLRAKRTIVSELTEVTGVGDKTARRLLRKFGSISALRAASIDSIEAEVGAKLARAVTRHLRQTSAG